tara:strand:- start:7846 stop:8757 length:912 start_codon:yes stop_codon:yes gene_type:complete
MAVRVILLLKFSVTVIHLFRKKSFDIIHVHSPMHYLVCLYFKFFCGCKTVLTIHGSEINLFAKYNFLKYLLFVYDRVLVVSHEQLNILEELIGEKVSFIPNAVDSIYFDYPSEVLLSNNCPGMREKLKIVTVGSLRWQKNHSLLIESIALSRYRHLIKLTHIGAGPDQDKLRELAIERNVDVHFKGTLNKLDIIRALDESHVFVLTSVVEGAPKALIEAMSRGLYCITTPVGECSSILGPIGHCLQDFKPETLAAQIDYIYDNPLDLGCNDIKTQAKAYTWERYLDVHVRLYAGLVLATSSKN